MKILRWLWQLDDLETAGIITICVVIACIAGWIITWG